MSCWMKKWRKLINSFIQLINLLQQDTNYRKMAEGRKTSRNQEVIIRVQMQYLFHLLLFLFFHINFTLFYWTIWCCRFLFNSIFLRFEKWCHFIICAYSIILVHAMLPMIVLNIRIWLKCRKKKQDNWIDTRLLNAFTFTKCVFLFIQFHFIYHFIYYSVQLCC